MKKLLLSITLLFSFLAFTNAQSGTLSFIDSKGRNFIDSKGKPKIKKIEIANEDGKFVSVGKDVASALKSADKNGSTLKVTIRKRDYKSILSSGHTTGAMAKCRVKSKGAFIEFSGKLKEADPRSSSFILEVIDF